MNIIGEGGLVDRLPILGWRFRGHPLWALAGTVVTVVVLAPAGMAVVMFLAIAERNDL